jgi:molecular chaperone GrpE
MPKTSHKTEKEPDYKELYQRSLAEQENQRKRLEQEKQQFAKFALLGAIENLLPIVDNFYRATEHVPAEQKDSPWLTGIMHIQKQLQNTLEAWGVEEIPTHLGDPLDPALHEAIGTVENSEIPEDHIVTVQNRGYRLNGRVIRPATVLTSKKNS